MKTTGVKDIPKFGLLVFLGHPSDHTIFWKQDPWLNLSSVSNRPAPLYAQASLLGGQEGRLTAGVDFEPCREGRRAPAHISARWAATGQFSTAAHLQLNPQKLSILQTRSEDRKLAPTLWRVLSPVHWVPTCSKHCKHCKGSRYFLM